MFIPIQQKFGLRAIEIKPKILATRPMFLTASVLPVLAGTAVGGYINGSVEYLPVIFALAAIVFVNLSINVFNDIYDDMNNTDNVNSSAIYPFTGGSRAIQDHVMTSEQMGNLGFVLLVISILFGAVLFLMKGPVILAFGVVGVFIGIAYSMPPLALASRGLGELSVWFGVGVLPVMGAVWLQTGTIEYDAMPIAMAVGLWVMNIILINEVPDRRADESVGKRTLVVRLDNNETSFYYLLSGYTAVALLFLFSLSQGVSIWIIFLPIVLLYVMNYAALTIRQYEQYPDQLLLGIKTTVASHALNCLWVTVWLFMI